VSEQRIREEDSKLLLSFELSAADQDFSRPFQDFYLAGYSCRPSDALYRLVFCERDGGKGNVITFHSHGDCAAVRPTTDGFVRPPILAFKTGTIV
jgi:hypothetical protein